MHFSAHGIFDKTAENIGAKCTLDELKQQFKQNNIVLSIGMGVDKSGDYPNTNPQIIYHGEDRFPPFMMQCAMFRRGCFSYNERKYSRCIRQF